MDKNGRICVCGGSLNAHTYCVCVHVEFKYVLHGWDYVIMLIDFIFDQQLVNDNKKLECDMNNTCLLWIVSMKMKQNILCSELLSLMSLYQILQGCN